MFGLLPKEEIFFTMFKEMTSNIVVGADLLKELLDKYPDAKELQQKIKDIEHKGDTITHQIIKKLNRSFITPFEPEDIYGLASALDNILDFIDASAQHLITYRVEKITDHARELGLIIVNSCRTIDRAVAALNGKTEHEQIAEFCVEINSLENEADKVCREAIGELFDNEKDPLTVIKLKEIYENLETVTDKCEDAANILENIIVKNA